MKKKNNLIFIIVGFVLLFVLLMFLQGCTTPEWNKNKPKPPSLIIKDTLYTKGDHPFIKYDFKYSGMHYTVIRMYDNSSQTINITKDSLEVEAYKRILNPKK